MAYIGTKPTIGNFQICDAISVVNGQAAYTMQVGSVNVLPQSANHMIVSLNGTIQKPNSSFTVSGSTITFSSNLATGDVIDFIQILGDVLDLGVPSDATVTAAKLNNTAITGQTAEATVADDDTVLIHDTSASALRKMTVSNLTANAGISGWSANGSNNDLLPANASAGIYLGVNSATAANLLNDYEEGSFTPKAEGSSTSGSSPTGAGRYTKIGNLVHVDFSFTNVTIGSASGDLRIKELPFTISGSDSVRGSFGGNVRFYNYNLDGNTYYHLTLVADENTTYLVVTQTRDHGTWSTLSVDNDSGLYVEGGITYTTTA